MLTALDYCNRRVIDIEDISYFEKKSIAAAKERNINLSYYYNDRIVSYEELKEQTSEFMEIHDGCYILLPWIERDDLILQFRWLVPDENFSLEGDVTYLPIRNEETLEKFNILNNQVCRDYYEKLKNNISELEEKLSTEQDKFNKLKQNILEKRI